jgi:O-antigen ligase
VVVVSLVPLAALAALGGAYASATFPILLAAVLTFLASGARVADRGNRALDIALIAVAAAVLLQLVPLPAVVVDVVSPQRDALRAGLYLDAPASRTTLTADPRLTRAGLASLISALLIFWSAREILGRGGIRLTARLVAWAGFALTLIAFVQRATAPDLLLWMWKPIDAGSRPFGPFVNPNHLATWLLMAASLTTGYVVAHTRMVGSAHTSARLRVRDWLADGAGLLLAGALLLMLVAIGATLSRAAMLGACAGLAAGVVLSRTRQGGRSARAAVAGVVLLLALAAWSNQEELARKFGSPTTMSRVTIWRDTLPVLRDFWLAGTGVGTYAPVMIEYQRTSRDLHFNQAHSEYLQAAAEGGVLLVLPVLAAIGAGLQLARRRLREETRAVSWVRIGAASGLIAVAVQGIFETGLRVPANALLAALLAAIVFCERHER